MARIVRTDREGWLESALEELRAGGLVAFPTDTVYGVGAPVFDRRSVARIYEAKGRPGEKAIPVLLASWADLDRVAEGLSEGVRRLAESFWPGPLTIVLRKRPEVPPEVSADETIGLRIPAHPIALELLAAAGPLATSSANRSGGPDSRSGDVVLAALGSRIGLVLDGGVTPGGKPSTVVDCTGSEPKMVRAGPVSFEKILAVWGGDSSGA